jgi:SpoIID/LytB domain protein
VKRVLLLALSLWGAAAGGDELSGADKLRVVYSNQFAWTREGLPLVTVGLAEGLKEVTVSGAGIRLLPDGEGGAVVAGGNRWTVRAQNTRPAKKAYHVVVARLANDAERAQTEMETWRGRGFSPRRFESGTVFAVRGKLFDSRRLLIAIAPAADEATAKKSAAEISAKFKIDTSVFPELAERPRGTLVATDERGSTVSNDSILWFRGDDLLELDPKHRYAGRIYVTLDNAGTLAVVNAVPEDRLLAGLVPAEMSAGSPPEALKAQAVAARNELLAKIGTRHLTDPYRLCSSVHCQVYAGAGHEDARATAAVEATRGELLLRDDGGVVDAVYSASCGGHTEDNDKVWGGPPDTSLRGVPDGADESSKAEIDAKNLDDYLDHPPPAWCAKAKEAGSAFRWQKQLDLAEIEKRAGVGKLRDLEVTARGVSGRAGKLKVTGDGGAREIAGELEIRRLLGNLKSALIRLRLEKDAGGHLTAAAVDGGGHGHGIGMCQLGAVGMAQAGKSYREILMHYYSAARLERLY